MANKKSVGHAYNVDFLNVVFAASSLFLFFTTIWMVFDDFDREWKGYQRQFVLLEGYVTSLSLQAAQAGIDQERLQQLNAERAAAEQELAANGERVAELESQLADVEADFYLANQQYNFLKADYDVERYAYEELQEEHPEEAAEVRPAIDDMYDRWVDLGLRVEELTARRDDLRAQIGEYTGGVADADAQIRDLTAEATRLAELVEDLQVDFVGDVLLNAPLLDFMAPSLTVQQTITPNVHDELNFIRFQKMDRCRTCHIAIDREGYEATRSRIRRIRAWRRMSGARRRIRWRPPAAPCVTRGWGSRSASFTPRIRPRPRSRCMPGRSSTVGRFHTCGTTRCCPPT